MERREQKKEREAVNFWKSEKPSACGLTLVQRLIII